MELGLVLGGAVDLAVRVRYRLVRRRQPVMAVAWALNST